MKKNTIFFMVMALFVLIFISCGSQDKAALPADAGTNDYAALVAVPGGTFYQSDGEVVFNHTISPFKIAKYEVTYILWRSVYVFAAANGYKFEDAGTEGKNGREGAAPTKAAYEPVTMVNWRDAIVWCNAYSQMQGLTLVYYTDKNLTMPLKDSKDGNYSASLDGAPGSFDNPFVKWDADGYRLPTEGEWQCAASYNNGKDWTPFNFASGAAADYTDQVSTGEVAWFAGNSDYAAQNAGTRKANELGIYDMSGNVFEWCWDWYAKYPGNSVNNYKGPARGASRVRRGGSYNFYAYYLPVGARFSYYPYHKFFAGGFRVAKSR